LQRTYGQESQVVLTTPIIEGLDGVQKMSKSLGNAVGIHEPPLQMYGKIMSISDDMMWRYYELLTDVSSSDIEKMRADAASGAAHPMNLKKELARRIVSDFHSAEAAAQAGMDWAKQFQKDEAPENVEEVVVAFADVSAGDNHPGAIRLDKLLARCGLTESVSDASRKIKQKAVRVDGETVTEPVFPVKLPASLLLRVGRSMKRAVVS
jgi:tyrosyl-tRNA synthetase